MKYITIDGLSGAGKTTQAKRIVSQIGWHELNRENFRSAVEQTWDMGVIASNLQVEREQTHTHFGGRISRFAHTISDIAVLRQAIDSQTHDFVVGDHFWSLLTHCYLHPNDGNVDQLLEIFMAAFSDKLPVASFFLRTDPGSRNLRILHRNANTDGYFSIKDVEVNASHNRDDADTLRYYQWLQTQVDVVPIHIIDNTNVSIDEVTTQILEKV